MTQLAGTLPSPLAAGIAGQLDENLSRASWTLQRHVLGELSRALQRHGRSAALLKGAALALSVYPRPWERRMGDLDLLVAPGEIDAVSSALVGAGLQPLMIGRARPRTARLLGEAKFVRRLGQLDVIVELHAQLDSVVARPVDVHGVLARSVPAPELAGLRLPAREDQALVVALHAAEDGLAHPWGMVDLHLLLAAGLDARVLVERAAAWRARTALYLALRRLALLGSSSGEGVPLDRLRPRGARARAVRRLFGDVDAPRALAARPHGMRRLMVQGVLRDDVAAYGAGLARYAAASMLERIERPSRGTP